MGFEIVGDRLLKYIEEDGVKNVIIPDGVRIIDKDAFDGCSEIESILIPESVKIIEKYTFYDCFALKHLTLYDNIEKIGYNNFKYTEIESITIKGKKTSIIINSRWYGFRFRFVSMLETIFEFLCADLSEKEKIVFEEIDVFYKKVSLVIYLFFEYKSQKAKRYIYRYSDYIVDLLIEFNEHELLAMLIPYISISEKNIDTFISNAINLKHTEIQLMLMHYKNNNFDFANGFDDLLL